ncbi:MAG TPA: antitoxin [Pyrinomonadaceae bacterium]|nr:antitoxin [Pyrinomonadaceae bacterium]
MSKTITMTELSRGLADLMNRVSYRGESFSIMKGKRVMAEIVPPRKKARISDLAKYFAEGPHLHPDDVEQFAKDIEEARRSVPAEDYDPWER